MTTDCSYTPPQLARRWRCSPDRIRAMIAAGELDAFNLAPRGQRPQYRIPPEAVRSFERARAVAFTPEPVRRRIAPRINVESFV